MAKITNPETLEARQHLLDWIALLKAHTNALELSIRRDYRKSLVPVSDRMYELTGMINTGCAAYPLKPEDGP